MSTNQAQRQRAACATCRSGIGHPGKFDLMFELEYTDEGEYIGVRQPCRSCEATFGFADDAASRRA